MITPAQREQLSAPFGPDDLEWKVQSCDKNAKSQIWALIVPYVAARAVQTRLDDVFGIGNWQAEYRPVSAGKEEGFICRLSVWDGSHWIAREDGAPTTDHEPLKGGISGAFKRAAVLWGIGRYLYTLDSVFADVGPSGVHRANLPQKKGGEAFRWSVPQDAMRAATAGAPAAPTPAPAAPSKAAKPAKAEKAGPKTTEAWAGTWFDSIDPDDMELSQEAKYHLTLELQKLGIERAAMLDFGRGLDLDPAHLIFGDARKMIAAAIESKNRRAA